MDTRDKSIVVGLFLSRYNLEGLKILGFKTFQEAYNILGYALGSNPSSIKNYRDEFDPLFLNKRKGWHSRPIRTYCKAVYDKYLSWDIDAFSDVVKSFYIPNYELEKIIHNIEQIDFSPIVAKRLATGKADEEYFLKHYHSIEKFHHFEIFDTTQMACGFDFRLVKNDINYCVEVKGLNDKNGSISLTEKEYYLAQKMKENYCLFIVSNFKEKPIYHTIFDPINSSLTFNESIVPIISRTYQSYFQTQSC